MMNRARLSHRAWTVGALVLLLGMPLWPGPVGCGGGEDTTQGMPPPTPRRERTESSDDNSGGGNQSRRARRNRGETTEVEVDYGTATGINRLSFAEGARDPFMRMFPDVPVETTTDASQQQVVQLAPEEANPEEWGALAQYDVAALTLVAIISRTSEPRAMFMVPDGSGRGVLARIEDRVGPDGTGRISDIQPNSVEITYDAVEFGTGEGARRLVLPLRDPSDSIEATFTPY